MSDEGMSESDTLQLILLGRIYDLLVVIARANNSESTSRVLQAHADGDIFMPQAKWK